MFGATQPKVHHIICQVTRLLLENTNPTPGYALYGTNNWKIPRYTMLHWEIKETNLWIHQRQDYQESSRMERKIPLPSRHRNIDYSCASSHSSVHHVHIHAT